MPLIVRYKKKVISEVAAYSGTSHDHGVPPLICLFALSVKIIYVRIEILIGNNFFNFDQSRS